MYVKKGHNIENFPNDKTSFLRNNLIIIIYCEMSLRSGNRDTEIILSSIKRFKKYLTQDTFNLI